MRTMNALTLALAQMDLALGQPDRNLALVRARAVEAKSKGADIIVLPELWGSAYDLEHAAAHASSIGAGLYIEIEKIARQHQIAIVGSLLESDGGRIYNTATFVDKQGNCLGVYRKLHLVPMLDEPQYLAPGDGADTFHTPFGPTALAICYDLRFPELMRHYALAGARIIFLPAEWPSPRIAHWRALLPARAIENQIYVVGTNRVGTSEGETFGGHSMVVNPWGDVLVEGDERESLLFASVDLDLVEEVRARVPVFRDRRPDVYDKFKSNYVQS